jgi:hypothetical protein
MSDSGHIATLLDEEMLAVHGALVAPPSTPDSALPKKTGAQVAAEIGDRFLFRYLRRSQVGHFRGGSGDLHYLTPTAYSRRDAVRWLALPAPERPPTHLLVVDPRAVATVLGPRRVRGGAGFEYLLPNGFPPSALLMTWEMEIR